MKRNLFKYITIFIVFFLIINTNPINTMSSEMLFTSKPSRTTGRVNNIVIFLKFAGQGDVYNGSYKDIEKLFNNENRSSLKNYLKTMSNNKLIVNSTFYPLDNSGNIYVCEVNNSLSYYESFSERNPKGYKNQRERERELLIEVLNKVKEQIPKELNIDNDNDGIVDSIVFIQPKKGEANGILWAHKNEFSNEELKINGKSLGNYIMMPLEDLKSYGVLCHEYLHILGLNDLYSLDSPRRYEEMVNEKKLIYLGNNKRYPLSYSIMYQSNGILTNYEREKLKWIDAIKVLDNSGDYFLTPSLGNSSKGEIAYKIPVRDDTSKYFILEYRKSNKDEYDNFEIEGLLVYGVDENIEGNLDSSQYELYTMFYSDKNDYKKYQSSYILNYDEGENYRGFNAFTLNNGEDNLGINISNVSFEEKGVKFKLTFNKDNLPNNESKEELTEESETVEELKEVKENKVNNLKGNNFNFLHLGILGFLLSIIVIIIFLKK